MLLGLRNTYGVHTGEEQRRHLVDLVKEYKITTKVSYLIADNASANDTTLKLLEQDLDIHAKKSRLRCAGHIINLVCKSILFGTNVACVDEVIRSSEGNADLSDGSVSQFEQLIRAQLKDEVEVLEAWRRKGPVGKLHNIVLHARSSEQRRVFFSTKQREATPEIKQIYQLVINSSIR